MVICDTPYGSMTEVTCRPDMVEDLSDKGAIKIAKVKVLPA